MSQPSDVILVVDDDPSIGEILTLLLEGLGYQPLWAKNGEVALQLLESRSELPRVILLDLMMPVMDGWELRSALLRDPRLAKIPIVIMTGGGDASGQAGELHAVAGLTKPVDLCELEDLLERVGQS